MNDCVGTVSIALGTIIGGSDTVGMLIGELGDGIGTRGESMRVGGVMKCCVTTLGRSATLGKVGKPVG